MVSDTKDEEKDMVWNRVSHHPVLNAVPDMFIRHTGWSVEFTLCDVQVYMSFDKHLQWFNHSCIQDLGLSAHPRQFPQAAPLWATPAPH